jgi:YHS domain-containing protein
LVFKEEAQASALKFMGFFGRLVRFIFWVLIVSWVIKLVGRLLSGGNLRSAGAGARGTTKQGPELSGRRLVRDPVCGTHMAEELALPLSVNGETQYFCSQECREKYESSVLRRAANA